MKEERKWEHMQEEAEQVTDSLELLTRDWSVDSEADTSFLLKELALGWLQRNTNNYIWIVLTDSETQKAHWKYR